MTIGIDTSVYTDDSGLPMEEITFEQGTLHYKTTNCRGDISLEKNQAYLVVPPGSYVHADYFLRLVAALIVFEAGGLMLHAATILYRDMAVMFIGPSGSGKTTIARHSPGQIVLNDDLGILIPGKASSERGDPWIVYSTPFTGQDQVGWTTLDAPLGGLFGLIKDRHVRIEEISRAGQLASMYASVPVIPLDINRNIDLLNRCDSILNFCPLYLLHFLPDNTFWEMVISRL
jgi:hypothetical protein